MNIQWFPGHMKKTKDLILENLKLVDIVLEIVDARVPMSSKNPDIDKFIKNKPKLIVVNKIDMADSDALKKWEAYYKANKVPALFISSQKPVDINKVHKKVREILKESIEKDLNRGMKERAIKTMIVGIPNVGKSTLINNLVKKKIADVGNKPGITRGKQWIKIDDRLELLDMPGILWPKFDDETIGIKLALIGSINEDILNLRDLSLELIKILRENEKYEKMLESRYNIATAEELSDYEVLENIGRKRGFVLKGNEIDVNRTAKTILDEFKNGKIGSINLDLPE